jgi:cell wall-associated NlpC family hydrolase
MITGAILAAAAETLVGTPFRLHGRDPATGIDCVGLLGAALERCGVHAQLPNGYSLRARFLPNLASFARDCGLTPVDGEIAPGDVLLIRIEPCQHHLLVATTEGRFIHAHAGLGRVIRCDAPLEGHILHHWRLAASD